MKRSSSPPTVSVVIPAYNAAPWIAETIDSVLAQTFSDFEVIVVDDGSTDETPNIVSSYEDSIRYLRKRNGGSASARNAGIRAAQGAYIAFVDADDLWMPQKLELQMDLLSNDIDLAWVYSDAFVVEEKSDNVLYRAGEHVSLHAGDILRPLVLHDFIPSPTPIVKREVFAVAGYFDESLRRSEDWDMWLRIAAELRASFVDQPLAKYRRHSLGKTGTIDLEYTFQSRMLIIEKALAQNPKRLSGLRDQAIANVYSGVGRLMLKRGASVNARAMFRRAVRLCPRDIKLSSYWLATFLPPRLLKSLTQIRRLVRQR
jgi:glycosyltransferase involved in cell wall biosynthesis